MLTTTETIAALATPVGTSAVALVRVSGSLASVLAETIGGRAPLPRHALRADYRDQSGNVVDDVLITFFQGPRSYTGEDTLEISTHGNPFIAQTILEDLFSRGCRAAEPGEFTKRAFLNGRMELSQAEAVMDLIHARSERALAAAHQQLRGSLGRRMTALIDHLLLLLARVEAYIDFPDEDLPLEDVEVVRRGTAELRDELDKLLATNHYGDILRDGVKTVILGEPNVGKSSLLNRLVGHNRALVSPEPGTTRDFIEERLTVGPHLLRLIDTAGLNPNPAPLEKLGMEKTVECVEEADLILWMADATRPLPSLPVDVAARLTSANTMIVLNKIDLVGDLAGPITLPEDFPSIKVSALTGVGTDLLTEAISQFVDAFRVEQGPEIIAVNARHAQALKRAISALAAATIKLERNEPVELLASDLRETLDAMGEISGKIDNERMLDRLFATFCIGK